MSKSTCLTLILLGLLLFASLTQAARSVPADQKTTQQSLVAAEVKTEAAVAVEGCGEDECMMRRTLEAHLDYIYTQEKQN